MNQKDSLKVVVLGNEGVGKSSLIQHLISNGNNNSSSSCGESSSTLSCSTAKKNKSLIPSAVFDSSSSGVTEPTASTKASSTTLGAISNTTTSKDPLVALNLYEWQVPRGEEQRSQSDDDNDVALESITVWDFSGHERFHSVQEMFFTPETLYIVVWDMAAQEIEPKSQERCCGGTSGNGNSSPSPPPKSSFGSQARCTSSCSDAFRLDYDSDTDSDDDCELDLYNQEEIRRLKRALDQDIDEKVQSWIDRIQARVPGATILPVATFADRFWAMYDCKEAKKRCKSLKERLLCHENCRYQDLKWRIESAASSEGGGTRNLADG